MMKKTIITFLSLLIASLSFTTMAANQKSFFPRGVYWPWERTVRNAKMNKMDTWQYTDKLMKMLRKDYNCNLIWVIHLPGKDNKKFCDLAQKHGLKTVMNTSMQSLSVWGFPNIQGIKEKAKKTVQFANNLPAYYAYTLKDEPKRTEVKQLNEYYKALSNLDKTRATTAVFEIRHIEAYFRQSEMNILCCDPYGFGGKKSPYLPNTPLKAQDYFRDSATALKKLAKATGKEFWMMPQAFAEIWGKFYTNENGDMILSPGAYIHWRMPTDAEIRWQAWEALRNGSKGIIYFVLLPPALAWKPTNGAPPHSYMVLKEKQNKKQKLPVITSVTNTNTSGALLRENLKPTSQFIELAKLYGKLKLVEQKIANGKPTTFPLAFSDAPLACGSFTTDNKYYSVIVNNNLESKINHKVFFTQNVSNIYDPVSKKNLTIHSTSENNNSLKYIDLELNAGDGTILEITLNKSKGICLFSEDFSLRPFGVKLDKVDVKYYSKGWGIPCFWTAYPKSVPASIKINNLVMSKPAAVTATAGFPKKGEDVYLKLNGKLNGMTINILDKSKKVIKSKNDKFYLPLLLPSKAYEIIIQIDAKDTLIEDIKIWTSPK
jgi:hypothetical protein